MRLTQSVIDFLNRACDHRAKYNPSNHSYDVARQGVILHLYSLIHKVSFECTRNWVNNKHSCNMMMGMSVLKFCNKIRKKENI